MIYDLNSIFKMVVWIEKNNLKMLDIFKSISDWLNKIQSTPWIELIMWRKR